MDKNRLIQIANHFDKIGAYTISDEFENKFIRMAAPVDRQRRDPRVQAIIDKTQKPGEVFQLLLKDANTLFDRQFPNVKSILKEPLLNWKQRNLSLEHSLLRLHLDSRVFLLLT